MDRWGQSITPFFTRSAGYGGIDRFIPRKLTVYVIPLGLIECNISQTLVAPLSTTQLCSDFHPIWDVKSSPNGHRGMYFAIHHRIHSSDLIPQDIHLHHGDSATDFHDTSPGTLWVASPGVFRRLPRKWPLHKMGMADAWRCFWDGYLLVKQATAVRLLNWYWGATFRWNGCHCHT